MKNKIKLVIWDLDETFWKGTLSEEGIDLIPEHAEIIKSLAHRGIVNSICSKNDYSSVKTVLEEVDLWGYFVFPHIDWTPKGKAVSDIIKKCQLRAENVLFIDDNVGNVNEVAFFNEGINTALPEIIPSLLNLNGLKGKDDSSLSRLQQYKVLEKKEQYKSEANLNNDEFLRSSEIVINYDFNVLSHIDRLWELEGRTNQLNFTKLRVSKEQLIKDIKLAEAGGQSAALFVKDKYGDYGLVGFYVLINNALKHFVFSCRVLNMKVENYVYRKLGSPAIEVVEPVSSVLDSSENVDFIQESNAVIQSDSHVLERGKLLLVGGCDLEAVGHYFNKDFQVETDFNYINSNSYSVHKEHTSLLRLSCEIKNSKLEKVILDKAIDSAPFISINDISSVKIFSEDWKYLVYSPLNDYSRGVYQSVHDERVKIPFELFNRDWTSCDIADIELPSHLKNFTKNTRESFSSEFTFIGPISEVEFKENLLWLVNQFPEREIILLTGSEVDANFSENVEMIARHKAMNRVVFEVAQESSNVKVCDVRDFIKSSDDLTDNIRHYTRGVYFSLAKDIRNKLLESGFESIKVSQISAFRARFVQYISLVKRIINKCKP